MRFPQSVLEVKQLISELLEYREHQYEHDK